MYFLAISLAVLGGILLGIFGTGVYFTYFSNDDDYYEGCRYEADEWEWK